MINSTFDALESLRKSAAERQSAFAGKTRIVVQVSHSSLAVGAGEVADALLQVLPNDAYLVTAGCDGASFAAPKVIVRFADGRTVEYCNLSPDDVNADMLTSVLADSDTAANAAQPDSNSSDFLAKQHRLTLKGCGEWDALHIGEYILNGGYKGLARALSMPPEDVIEEVLASGLRGRGGAYFPAALKWRGARAIENMPRYIVVNCEEGEPGIFPVRHLMEGAPYRLIEGTITAAYASGVQEAYIYINAEANLSFERMQNAVEQAYAAGLLGDDILSSGFALDMRIMRGAGGYVCGDETTLLNTMEGQRREPRQRPPFPTEAGLWGMPTVINNAETLASVPFILTDGVEAFASIGADDDNGTKIISLSGSVCRPGAVEVPMGTTLREIIYDIGGGIAGDRALSAIAIGGPSSGILPASMLDTPIKPGFIHESGVMLGSGGVIALDDSVSAVDMMRKLAAYNAAESCGKCTPCREGTPRMVKMVDDIVAGKAQIGALDELRQLAELVNAASLCGLGQAAGNPVLSALHFFGDELAMMAGERQ
ncbi:MAG: SLBB domain-containing protein [Chloroflexi bacterium]|nr:SLBB domain-containing protein [Chloroflexota bacterium]